MFNSFNEAIASGYDTIITSANEYIQWIFPNGSEVYAANLANNEFATEEAQLECLNDALEILDQRTLELSSYVQLTEADYYSIDESDNFLQ